MTQDTYVDANPDYWDDYSNLQRVKHELIQEYLNGWFPILGLGSLSGRIAYIDTHAGRGIHSDNELGSPFVALDTFLCHSFRVRILKKCEVVFWFIERDEKNYESLIQEIIQVDTLPSNVIVQPQLGDCFSILQNLIESLNTEGNQLAPAFIFVDPYGFKVPGSILRDLMKFPKVELFVNVMWRWLHMALADENRSPGMTDLLTSIFDGPAWQTKITASDYEKMAEQTIDLLKEMIGAEWATSARMIGPNNLTKYMLVHFTNHNKGRDLMKRCFWNVFPDGDFRALPMDNRDQQLLFSKEPDWPMLEAWIRNTLIECPRRWREFHELVRPLDWCDTHVNYAMRTLKKRDIILVLDGKKFTIKDNPLLSLK